MNKSALGISIGCVSAAVAGYLLARQPISVAASDAVISSARSRSSVTQGDRMEPGASGAVVKSRTAAQLTALKEDLRKRFRNSPAAAHDWTLRERAAAILATMSPQELEEFSKEFLPANSVPDIRSFRRIADPLFHETLRQWGLIDPEGACQSLAATHLGALTEIFGQWQQRDPATAKTWLEHTRFPKDHDAVRDLLERKFMTQQVTDDFSAARESLGKLDPEAQKQMLRSWSELLAHDPEKRVELLALLAARGDEALAEKCYQNLVWEMADKSPADAAGFIESSDLTEDRKNKLNDHVLVNWALQDPQQAFGKWAELDRTDIPPNLLQALANWSMSSPGAEQAIDWSKNLPPGPAREQFKARLIERMSSGERYGQAADLSASLDDPAERIRQLKTIKRYWEEKSPKSSDEWYGKLPQEDQDAIGRKLE